MVAMAAASTRAGSTIAIADSNVTDNTAYYSGAGIAAASSPLQMRATTVSHNESQGYGGGVWAYEDPQAGPVRVDIVGSTLFDNYAAAGGGAVYSSNSSLTLADSRAIDNDSDGYGGGVSTAGSTIAINRSRIRNNSATAAGGAVYSYDSSLTLADTRVSSNSSDGYGGARLRLRLQGRDRRQRCHL